MVKRYKHKRTGLEFTKHGNLYMRADADNIPLWVVEQSSDWEEVTEKPKDYEILSFKHKNATTPTSVSHISADYYIGHPEFNIHSVKRLSDGVVFTVGDKVGYPGCDNNFVIGSLVIDTYGGKQDLVASEYGTTAEDTQWCTIFKLLHAKKPLFTTEDGKPIYTGDKCYVVDIDMDEVCVQAYDRLWSAKVTDFSKTQKYQLTEAFYKFENQKYFSTEEAAEEYILYNKPCLSLKDIIDLYRRVTVGSKADIERLKQLVKSKLEK